MPFIQKQQAEHPASQPLAETSFEDLCQQLESPVASERRTAASLLAAYPDSSSHLSIQLLRETEHSVREVIMTSLTVVGDSNAINTLIICLRSEEAELRNEAIDALKHLPQAIGPHIQKLLADPDTDVRIFTVNVLSSLAHTETERWLCEVLNRDKDPNVCGAALDVLAEIGTQLCVMPVRQVCARFPKDAYLQFAAKIALTRAAGV
jgi:HEAT repeat protein